jgi:hypothetical protein
MLHDAGMCARETIVFAYLCAHIYPIMLLLPFEKIVYKTALTSDEILFRLSGAIGRQELFGVVPEKPYKGRFGDHMFEIQRVITHRNSFLPKISGVIDNAPNGITIHVKMRLPISILIFISLWLLAFGAHSVALIIDLLATRIPPNAETLAPIGMFLFGYGLTIGGFKFESIKSRNDLRKLFEADILQG